MQRLKYRQLPQDPRTLPSRCKDRILVSDQRDLAALNPIDDSRHIVTGSVALVASFELATRATAPHFHSIVNSFGKSLFVLRNRSGELLTGATIENRMQTIPAVFSAAPMTVVPAIEARRAPEDVPLLNLERVERVVVWMAAGGKGGRSPAQRTLDAGWQPVRRRGRVRHADASAMTSRSDSYA